MNSLLSFIKYNNALPIALMVIFTGFGAALASSPEVRDSIVSSEEVVRSVDNSLIRAVDLSKFNFGLRVVGVKEDEDNYYVTYTYSSLAIVDYVWKPVVQTKELVVSKAMLANHYLKDLGLYVAKETSDMINAELDFLKRTQLAEQQKGPSDKVVSKVYKGLIGKRLDAKDQVFPGYATVIASEVEVKEKEMAPEEVKALVDKIMAERAVRLARDEREDERKERELREKAALAALISTRPTETDREPEPTTEESSIPASGSSGGGSETPAASTTPDIPSADSEVVVPEVQEITPVVEVGDPVGETETPVETPVVQADSEPAPTPEPEPPSDPVAPSGDGVVGG